MVRLSPVSSSSKHWDSGLFPSYVLDSKGTFKFLFSFHTHLPLTFPSQATHLLLVSLKGI